MLRDDPILITDEQSDELVNIVHLSVEDYAGNFVLPSYGVTRLGADYYASNLNVYVFVIAELSCMSISMNISLFQIYLFEKKTNASNFT